MAFSSSTPRSGSSAPEHGVTRRSRALPSTPPRFTREFGAAGRLARMQVLQDRHGRAHAHRLGERRRYMQARVYDELDAEAVPLRRPCIRIGIDETSYKKGHKYMTVVLDHDANRVVWCAKGTGRPCSSPSSSSFSEDQRASIRWYGRRRALDSGARGVLLPQRREGHTPSTS